LFGVDEQTFGERDRRGDRGLVGSRHRSH
jgi:hypothetical protein